MVGSSFGWLMLITHLGRDVVDERQVHRRHTLPAVAVLVPVVVRVEYLQNPAKHNEEKNEHL